MKLKIGGFYRTRDGRKVGPMRKPHGVNERYQWDATGEHGTGQFYKDTGEADDGHDYDLIAEWVDEPAAQPAAPVRTVTRKEIVPGAYGRVHVTSADDGVDIEANLHSDDIASIRAAIATLTEIADALEDTQ